MLDYSMILWIVILAIFSVKKYKSNMKYGCCGSGGETGRRVEAVKRCRKEKKTI